MLLFLFFFFFFFFFFFRVPPDVMGLFSSPRLPSIYAAFSVFVNNRFNSTAFGGVYAFSLFFALLSPAAKSRLLTRRGVRQVSKVLVDRFSPSFCHF